MNGYGPRSYENNSSARYPADNSAYLDAPKALHRNGSTISSNQDGDSVLDLYGGRLSTVSAMSADTVNGQNGYMTDEESKWIDSEKLARIDGEERLQKDRSRWVDRDKLERIEIQELEQAGILPLSPRRGTFNIRDRQDAGSLKRQRTHSDSSSQPEDERYFDPTSPSNDLRRPAEQSSDSTSYPMRHGNANKSSSKIPLFKTSPLPVPTTHKQRTAPLKRQQPSPEGSEEEEGGKYRAHRRSYSAGSSVLLNNEVEGALASGVKPEKPKPTRTQSNQFQGTTQKRETKPNPRMSRATSLSKRSKSNPHLGPSQRPGTGTSHQAPEGPPPWSLSTYSPDPKLPPEKQLIPTVAKRLQQEQWEKEGVFATVYDGKLRPLKVEDMNSMQRPRPPQTEENTEGQDDSEWPLKSPTTMSPRINSPPSPKPPSVKPTEESPPASDNPTVSVNSRLEISFSWTWMLIFDIL